MTREIPHLPCECTVTLEGVATHTLETPILVGRQWFISKCQMAKGLILSFIDLSARVDAVKEENLKLKSENQVLGQYIENLMSASSVFQTTDTKSKRK